MYITAGAGAEVIVIIQQNAVNLISYVNKQAPKRHLVEIIAIVAANFIMVQIFIEGLKPELKNEMIKTSKISLAQAFERAEELEKHAK
jgi:hypothetical protein